MSELIKKLFNAYRAATWGEEDNPSAIGYSTEASRLAGAAYFSIWSIL
jgi:hypothetical protein